MFEILVRGLAILVAASLPAALPMKPVRAASESLLYSFKGGKDGGGPNGLSYVGGKLYGTTYQGGGSGCVNGEHVGCGTVFKVALTGSEKVLHRFAGSDGSLPGDALTYVSGTFYGTTFYGGSGHGTVFSVSPAGNETVLHSFGSVAGDGSGPESTLLKVGAKLYGTTGFGGSVKGKDSNFGTVFWVTPAGAEKVIYSFKGGPDGSQPTGNLIDVNGVLYGTTSAGGNAGCVENLGCGTVFSVTPKGAEKVVYSFASSNDGNEPSTGLVELNGTLYGVTYAGGGTGCGGSGCGTVYSVTPAGVENLLYSFQGGSDGAGPAWLLIVGGTLYGTTSVGGGTGCGGSGCGTVFSITPSGTESVVYSFQGGTDGYLPYGLIDVNGTVFGTTTAGGGTGCAGYGCGTVFKLLQ